MSVKAIPALTEEHVRMTSMALNVAVCRHTRETDVATIRTYANLIHVAIMGRVQKILLKVINVIALEQVMVVTTVNTNLENVSPVTLVSMETVVILAPRTTARVSQDIKESIAPWT